MVRAEFIALLDYNMGEQLAPPILGEDCMTNYPFTNITRYDGLPQRENGSPVYAVWRHLAADNASVKGFITKTERGTWQIDLATRCYGQRITETSSFSDAKTMVRELLA